MNWRLENGVALNVRQTTEYPWSGDVDLAVSPAQPTEFTLFVRIPGWADGANVAVNGKAITGAKGGSYLPIQRKWAKGDAVRLQFPMQVQAIESNPQIVENVGRVMIQRGPVVYCLEEVDQANGVKLADAALRVSGKFREEMDEKLLGGMVVIRSEGAVYERPRQQLYSRYEGTAAKSRSAELKFIPYYAWANRQPSVMQVWVPVLAARG
jgi:hypothetical protein